MLNVYDTVSVHNRRAKNKPLIYNLHYVYAEFFFVSFVILLNSPVLIAFARLRSILLLLNYM